MGELVVGKKLQGDYGELVFEHYCQYNDYAYITLEEIYNTLTPRNILTFRCGYDRIRIKVPDSIISELTIICKPSNNKEQDPSFVYDYLTFPLNSCFNFINKDVRWQQYRDSNKDFFSWVEIKTGKSKLTKNQERMKKFILLPLCIFRIETELPKTVNVDWHVEQKRKPGLRL